MEDLNFFIEEPQNLRSNFFNKDKSLQLAQRNHNHHDKKVQHFHPSSISFMMKKPDFKMKSPENVKNMLKVQNDRKFIDSLSTVLDDHFIELVKNPEYVDNLEDLMAYVDKHSELLTEIENTRSLLKPILDISDSSRQRVAPQKKKLYYLVDYIEF